MANQPVLSSAGIKAYSVANLTQSQINQLGPLANLIGVWENAPAPEGKTSTGWNVIMVPGPQNGFKLEVMSYSEVLEFKPVVIAAANKGPFSGNNEEVQHIVGLMYNQKITSLCHDQCTDPDLKAPNVIHMETGLFLNVKDFNTQAGLENSNGLVLDFARLATIPHGNSVLAIGQTRQPKGFSSGSIKSISGLPEPINDFDSFRIGYLTGLENPSPSARPFPEFPDMDPNHFLNDTIKGQTFSNVWEITMDTGNATGGILNIPFIQNNVTTSQVSSSFWIEQLTNGTWQLQYSQFIYLLFPGPGSNGKPIQVKWPHTTINTLRKSNLTTMTY